VHVGIDKNPDPVEEGNDEDAQDGTRKRSQDIQGEIETPENLIYNANNHHHQEQQHICIEKPYNIGIDTAIHKWNKEIPYCQQYKKEEES
jgi:hypothetical protein